MIAALFVQKNGAYYGIPGVDPWDEERDARKYPGGYPVIAHPPCQRWGKMFAGSPSVIAKTGVRKKLGDDNGCFESALNSVRKWGGVLEHPWGSRAFAHFGIMNPERSGGWKYAMDEFGGMVCCVEQGRYGHYAPKPTILYAVGCKLPKLNWGITEVKDSDFPAWAMERYGREKCRRIGLLSFKGGGKDSTPRIHTPDAFRSVLIEMAESAWYGFTQLKKSPVCACNGAGSGARWPVDKNKERMNEQVDKLTSRHIAKCLDHLGDTIAPVQIASIKRSFRFFAEDIKHVMNGEAHGITEQEDSRGNR